MNACFGADGSQFAVSDCCGRFCALFLLVLVVLPRMVLDQHKALVNYGWLMIAPLIDRVG